MVKKFSIKNVQLFGAALEGPSGSPFIVLRDINSGRYLSLDIDPYDLDFLLREIFNNSDETSTAWIAELLPRKRSYKALLMSNEEADPRLLLTGNLPTRGLPRLFRIGEGLAMAHRLGVKLTAQATLFQNRGEEIASLASQGVFGDDMLFLNPPYTEMSLFRD